MIAASFARDPRADGIQDAVRNLSQLDEHCLIAFLLGYKSNDQAFLSLIDEWLRSNRAMNARVLAPGGD